MSDLIERDKAIEAIENVDWYHQNRNKDMVSGANDDEHQAWYKADDIYKVLEAVPSAMPKEHTCEYCHYEYIDARKYPCSICACAERRVDMFQPKGKESE